MIPGPPGRRACTFGVTGFRVTPTVTLMTAPIYFTLPADRAIVCGPRRGPPVRAGDRRRVPRLRPQRRGRGRGRRGEAARVGRHSALALLAVGRRRQRLSRRQWRAH